MYVPCIAFLFYQVGRCVVCQICMSDVLFFVSSGRRVCGLSDMYVPCIVFCFTRSAGVPRRVPCQDGAVSLPVRHGSARHLPPPRGCRNAIFTRHSGSDTSPAAIQSASGAQKLSGLCSIYFWVSCQQKVLCGKKKGCLFWWGKLAVAELSHAASNGPFLRIFKGVKSPR